MAFPTDPLPVVIELFYSDAWNAITSDVYARDSGRITIGRGFTDEWSPPTPSTCDLTLRNVKYQSDGALDWAGRYSPRNPMSPLYGLIGRNTPIRVRIADGADLADDFDRTETDQWGTSSSGHAWTVGSGTAGSFDVTPGAGTVVASGPTLRAITAGDFGAYGDGIEVLVRANLTVDTATFGVVTHWTDSSNHYRVGVNQSTGALTWTAVIGGSSTVHTADETVTVDFGTGYWFRAFVDGRHAFVKFWADGDAEPAAWQLQAYMAAASPLTGGAVGCFAQGGLGGIAAFSQLSTTTGVRWCGEISEWPVRWDISGRDAWVDVRASGILRRLGQGDKPVRSPLHSATLAAGADGSLLAYWTGEDGSGAGSFGSALPGGAPMTYTGDRPDFAAIGPLLGSDKIAVLGATTVLTGPVPAGDDGVIAVRCLMDVPVTPGWTDATPLLHVRQTGASTVAKWEVRYRTASGGSLEVRALDDSGTQLDTSGALGFAVDGKTFYLGFTVAQDGSDADWSLFYRQLLDDGVTVDSLGFFDQPFTGLTVGHAEAVLVAPTGGLDEMAIGHLAVSTDADFGERYAGDGLNSGLASFAGEQAHERAARLCVERGVPLRVIGDESVQMGPQATPSTFRDALAETWAADMALLYETRDSLGLTFRCRKTLHNQPVAISLDYTGPGELADGLEVTDDDVNVRNDVTVERTQGGSARAVQETGPNNVQSPIDDPEGIGRYDTQDRINLLNESELANQAAWRRHVGTTDEVRYTSVPVNLTALAAAGKSDKIAAVASLEVFGRFQITDPPAWAPPGPADALPIGLTETIGHPNHWEVTIRSVPSAPYFVFEIGDQVFGRLDTSGSALALGVDSDDTSLLVATDSGKAVWINSTDRPDDFPFAVTMGGEIVTVTAISGTTSPQTFTVTRRVNGVTKSHTAGTDVRVARVAVP